MFPTRTFWFDKPIGCEKIESLDLAEFAEAETAHRPRGDRFKPILMSLVKTQNQNRLP